MGPQLLQLLPCCSPRVFGAGPCSGNAPAWGLAGSKGCVVWGQSREDVPSPAPFCSPSFPGTAGASLVMLAGDMAGTRGRDEFSIPLQTGTEKCSKGFCSVLSEKKLQPHSSPPNPPFPSSFNSCASISSPAGMAQGNPEFPITIWAAGMAAGKMLNCLCPFRLLGWLREILNSQISFRLLGWQQGQCRGENEAGEGRKDKL